MELHPNLTPPPPLTVMSPVRSQLDGSCGEDASDFCRVYGGGADSVHRRRAAGGAHYFAGEFRVGQLIKHKRYGYRAVIIGIDPVCLATSQWKEQMGVSRLSQGGENQPFFTCLVDARDRPNDVQTYVAKENLEPIARVRH